MMLDANEHCALLRADLAEAEHTATLLAAKQRDHKDTCPVCQATNGKPEAVRKKAHSMR
jgi:hypothetical protein